VRIGLTGLGFVGAVAAAFALACASPAAAQQGLLQRDPAVCGGADSAWAEAAAKNAESLTRAEWSPFGSPEKGWETYLPLIQSELRTSCGPGTPEFARLLAEFQARYHIEADGLFGSGTFVVFKGLWQERRPFILARLRGECPVAPASYIMTNLPAREDTYDREDRRLRGDALKAYRDMVAAARRDGVMRADPKLLTLFSGYRQADVDGERCASEGNCDGKRRATCSPHATGFAVDINLGFAPGSRIDSTSQANRLYQSRTEAYRWLVRNAHRFGFVNYVYEPWHWEWVGAPAPDQIAAVAAAAQPAAYTGN
jgi:hypothetical protein